MSTKDKSGITQVTFDKSAAQLVMDALAVDKCFSCKKQITKHSYGGSIVLKGGPAHFHNSLPCLLMFIKESTSDSYQNS